MGTMVAVLNGLLKEKILAVQEFALLGYRSVRDIFSRPRYLAETFEQMDNIGVGSLPIVALAAFFIGAVL
ncbi:MAG: ABC transporter permease, partial [Candidatus Acidiferrales bacterium]